MKTFLRTSPALLLCLLFFGGTDAVAEACPASAEESPADSRHIASIPLDLTRRGPVVDGTVNGSGPFRLLVDSGGIETFLSHEIVGPLGNEIKIITTAAGIYDREAWKGATTNIESITIGDLTFRNVPAVIVDLSSSFESGEIPHGLIGFNLFSDYLLTLDFPKGWLLAAKGRLPEAAENDVFDYTEEEIEGIPGKYPAIRIELPGEALQARLDMASGGEIMLPRAFEEKFQLANVPGRMGMARTPGGDFEILGGTLDGSARIGSYTLKNPKLRFSELYDDASLGTDLLSQFAITFDQANHRVRFEKPLDYKDPLHAKAAAINPVSGKGEDLRTAFNTYSDKVQMVLILSPT